MKQYQNILYASDGLPPAHDALAQGLRLARENGAAFKILMVYPPLPAAHLDYQDVYEQALEDNIKQAVNAAAKDVSGDNGGTEEPVKLENTAQRRAGLYVIQRILRDGHDFLIKDSARSAAEKSKDEQKDSGFLAVDMMLLRKCPCPVWLSRPARPLKTGGHIAVAIDPESEDSAGQDLALKLVKTAKILAESFDAHLSVISCWDYIYESYLHGNILAHLSDTELAKYAAAAQNEHRAALNDILVQAGADDIALSDIHHIKGRPEDIILQLADEIGVDMLVMGTLARTGIPGLIIGNTAENILQRLRCSLLALKPNGFVSPVKAYD